MYSVSFRPCYTRQFFLQLVSQRWRLKNIASCRGGVTRSQYFFATCNAPAGNCLQLFLRQFEISCERKTDFDCLIFTKLRYRLRRTCHTQQLVSQRCEKLRIFLLFLQLATHHFVAAVGGVTREIFLATCLATYVARQVARKIASCNMAFSVLIGSLCCLRLLWFVSNFFGFGCAILNCKQLYQSLLLSLALVSGVRCFYFCNRLHWSVKAQRISVPPRETFFCVVNCSLHGNWRTVFPLGTG